MSYKTAKITTINLIIAIIVLFLCSCCITRQSYIEKWVVTSVAKDGKTFRASSEFNSGTFIATDSVWIGKLINVSIGK